MVFRAKFAAKVTFVHFLIDFLPFQVLLDLLQKPSLSLTIFTSALS